ncbi:ester cyclase [Nannocystis pusilla]|uniref:ester cyclase n=1 Tax=Nannocystis pusilla TaxID=889268 RepID=UPI003B7E6C6C
MSIEANKDLVRRLVEAINRDDAAAFAAIVAPEFLLRDAVVPTPPGPAGFRQVAAVFHAAFPDFEETAEDVIAEGDRVVLRWTARGTHRGEFLGVAPTGREIGFSGMAVFRVADGMLVESWQCHDRQGMLRQLGLA